MKNRKVIWYEGMTLDPHHFQQWDRYQRDTLNGRLRALAPFDWGLLELQIDRETLANGVFKINQCNGVMPDGLPFHMPDSDPVPPFRNIEEHFPPTQSYLPVYLAIPNERDRGLNCTFNDRTNQRSVRFSMEEISINDDNSGMDERTVGVARSNFQLLIGNETTEDFSALKIAEVSRNAEGTFVLSEEFIPACLAIKASDNLTRRVRGILELLVSRGNALKRSRRQLPTGQYEINPADVPVYLNLFAINAYIPVLNQYLSQSGVHPATVFESLLSLTGQLATFYPDDMVNVNDLPLYSHADPSGGFLKLEKYIRQLLGDIVPAKNYVTVDLQKKGETLYVGQIEDGTLLDESTLYVICKGDIPETKIEDEFPSKMRVASKEMIHEILSTATRALPVTYSSQPPNGVPSRPEHNYYKIEKQGHFWKSIQKNRTLAIYIPAEFRNVSIELIAVK